MDLEVSERPILYSFRRCPYAMRARLAIASAEFEVGLREFVLRDKPAEMLEVSPKGTVPVLVLPDGIRTLLHDMMEPYYTTTPWQSAIILMDRI